MISRPIRTRREALLTCTFVALTAVICAGLMSAAVLVPAPVGVLPLIVATCIGCPMLAALQLPALCVALRDGWTRRWAADARLLADMRRYLRQLPETPHPLDR
jgi:hypothetical protein